VGPGTCGGSRANHRSRNTCHPRSPPRQRGRAKGATTGSGTRGGSEANYGSGDMWQHESPPRLGDGAKEAITGPGTHGSTRDCPGGGGGGAKGTTMGPGTLRALISVGHVLVIHWILFHVHGTLHIQDANVDALAKSLVQLKHMSYLSIVNTNISMLPENIGKMKLVAAH
jgi:hypothetical protein